MKAPAFWNRDSILSMILSPLGAAYAAGGRTRRGLARPVNLPVPVICIGNLVAGGAGKTPVVLSVAGRLIARGLEVHFLSRGYGGSLGGPLRVSADIHGAGDVGDEPLLLARAAPCWVARDRAAGARAAVDAGAGAIVMDDGLQTPWVANSASIVAVYAEPGFAHGRVLPAGPLREPVGDGLARADAIVILGKDRAGVAEALPPGMPVLYANLEPLADAQRLKGARVYAFAGIGRPDKFFATLESLGCVIAGRRGFADHHPYSAAEVTEIIDAAAACDALPVTTEKDAVRLSREQREQVTAVGVKVVWRDPGLLDAVLAKALGDG